MLCAHSTFFSTRRHVVVFDVIVEKLDVAVQYVLPLEMTYSVWGWAPPFAPRSSPKRLTGLFGPTYFLPNASSHERNDGVFS